MTEVKHGPAIDTAKVGTPASAATITSLRPIIHPSAEIHPSRGQLPAPLRPPPLHHIFAEAFSRLPSLLSIWGNIVEESGRALYHYLFSPTLVSDTAEPAVDEPLDEPLDVPPRRKEETIFSQLVSAYVDVPSSFDDPLRLSAPQVPADDSPITTFPPTTLTPPPFDPLVQHLHVQLQDHFVKLRAENVLHPHVTFIVGPPDHPNARYSLHSHLVGCFTTPYGYPSEYHTALFVPTGPGQAWTGPAEWGPLMVYLAASFLWPDLSFLVVSPAIMLGAHASYEELQHIFDTTAALVLFSSATSIVRDDILYHPGLPSKFANDVPFKCTDPPFRSFTPAEVSTSISDTTSLHLDKSTEWRANIKPHTLDADRQFPLLCTPYYGFVSELALDTTVALLNLANFLIACCYTPAGTPHDLYNIGDSPPGPYELLALFSYLPSDLPTGKVDVYPGTGVFICDPSSIPSPTLPTEMCWLYRSSAIPPRPTTHFPSLTTTLTPGLPSRRVVDNFVLQFFKTTRQTSLNAKAFPLDHTCVFISTLVVSLPPFLTEQRNLLSCTLIPAALEHGNTGTPSAMMVHKSL